MDMQKAKQLVLRLYDEVYSGGKVNTLDQYFSNTVKFHDQAFPNFKPGLANLREWETAYWTAFPNKRASVEDLLIAGDKIVVRWNCKGSHEGEFNGTAATHRKFNISGISIYQFANDRICEVWQSWDTLALYEQLNIIQGIHAHH